MGVFNAYTGFEPVRLSAGKTYCSGTLIAADLCAHEAVETNLVLTCAHFFRATKKSGYLVHSQRYPHAEERWKRRVHQVRTINGTDIAVVRFSRAIKTVTPALGSGRVLPGTAVTTIGFGGHRNHADTRPGHLILPLPLAVSNTGETRVRHAGIVFNAPRAVKGDSGGPTFARGRVVGVQSLVFDPFGRNLGFATISLLAPHIPAIRAACSALLA